MSPGEIRVVPLIPDPEHAWIAFAPREWPAAPQHLPWLDIARGRLGEPGRGEPVRGLHPEPFDDLVYLPPVAPEFAPARDELAARLAAPGTPVLVQLRPGEAPPAAPVTALWDPTMALLADDLDVFSRLPAGGFLLWPLIPGVTDDPEVIAEGCRRLAAAGVAGVQAVVPDLTPAERRRFAEERGEGAFDRLFHGPGADPRAFGRIAHGVGLAPFLPRPLPRPPLAGAGNREVAGLVALSAELAGRLGQPAGGVQARLRSARSLDRCAHDLRALAREGHLHLLDWLDPASTDIVTEWAATGASAALAAALSAYLGTEGLSSAEEGTNR